MELQGVRKYDQLQHRPDSLRVQTAHPRAGDDVYLIPSPDGGKTCTEATDAHWQIRDASVRHRRWGPRAARTATLKTLP